MENWAVLARTDDRNGTQKTVSFSDDDDRLDKKNWYAPAWMIRFLSPEYYGLDESQFRKFVRDRKIWVSIEYPARNPPRLLDCKEVANSKKKSQTVRAVIVDQIGRSWRVCEKCFRFLRLKAKAIREKEVRNADEGGENLMAMLPAPKPIGKTSGPKTEFLNAEDLEKMLGKKAFVSGKIVAGPRETKSGKGFIMDVRLSKGTYAVFLWADSVSLNLCTSKFGRNSDKWKNHSVKLSIYEGKNANYVNVDPE